MKNKLGPLSCDELGSLDSRYKDLLLFEELNSAELSKVIGGLYPQEAGCEVCYPDKNRTTKKR